MNTIDAERRALTGEVLELGQALFDELIAFAERHQGLTDEDEAFPIEDVNAATEEFFQALRVLLGQEQGR